ncbi:MAG: ATP-binding protein, partial [Planctomycetota bacterium]
ALVDVSLTPEARRAASTVGRALIGSVSQRAMSVFLESDSPSVATCVQPKLVADLLLEALSGFVRDSGGQVTYAIRIADNGEATTPTMGTVRVEGLTLGFMKEGILFACLPEQRIVVVAEPYGFPGTEQTTITVLANRDPGGVQALWEQYAREHNYLRGRSFFADGELIERKRRYSWDDILLPESVRGTLRTHVEDFLRHREALRTLGVKARRGVILSGPPGTGKTLVGKILSDQLDVSFLWVSPRHIRNAGSFEGILSVARFVAPTVVFLEDLDLFAEERDRGGGACLGELMNQLDGAVDNEDIVTIATTNRLDVIEKALRNRPGRFDRIVEMDVMDAVCRRNMLQKLLAHGAVSDLDIAYLVESTEEYTGAQLEELVNTMYILAVQSDSLRVDTSSAAQVAAGPAGTRQPRIYLDRGTMTKAIDDVKIQRSGRLGFHVA